MDIDNVSQSSSSSEGSDDGSIEEEEGAYAFSYLKRNAELQRLNPQADGRSKQQQRTFLLSNIQDCFSVSSLEIDLDDHDEDENDMEHGVSRFSARSSRLGSMDCSPALPVSSDRPQQLQELRRVLSRCAKLDDSGGPLGGSERRLEEQILPCQSFRQTLRESRWSSSSERSLDQDALGVLLDKASFSANGGEKEDRADEEQINAHLVVYLQSSNSFNGTAKEQNRINEISSSAGRHCRTPSTGTRRCLPMEDQKLTGKSFGQEIKESRWSPSSERSLHQEALGVLLDKVSFYCDDDGVVDEKGGEEKSATPLTVKKPAIVPSSRRRMRLSLFEQQERTSTGQNTAPALPRRFSEPMDRK